MNKDLRPGYYWIKLYGEWIIAALSDDGWYKIANECSLEEQGYKIEEIGSEIINPYE